MHDEKGIVPSNLGVEGTLYVWMLKTPQLVSSKMKWTTR